MYFQAKVSEVFYRHDGAAVVIFSYEENARGPHSIVVKDPPENFDAISGIRVIGSEDAISVRDTIVAKKNDGEGVAETWRWLDKVPRNEGAGVA